MTVEIPFRREFSFEYGRLEPVTPLIRRIVARNPSPFRFRGTGTYVIGRGEVAVIDPGPDLAEHVEALLAGLSGEQVTHILITHTHRAHSPAAAGAARRSTPRVTPRTICALRWPTAGFCSPATTLWAGRRA